MEERQTLLSSLNANESDVSASSSDINLTRIREADVEIAQPVPTAPADGLEAKAGIILVRYPIYLQVLALAKCGLQGLHNVFIVIPQFLVTGISAIIFTIFDSAKPTAAVTTPETSERHADSIVYVFM
jgi:hypothetical protein